MPQGRRTDGRLKPPARFLSSLTRYTSTAVLASDSTLAVTLPSSRRDRPLRPWLPMKIRSQPWSAAAWTMPSATLKLDTARDSDFTPAVSARSVICFRYLSACSAEAFS